MASLQGAKELIDKNKPILFFEGCKEWMSSFQYTPRDFDKFLASHGYRHLQVVGKKLSPILSLEDFFENKTQEASFNFLAEQI